MKIIRQEDYPTNAWAGGITREVFIYPESSSLAARNFDVRISSAVIDSTESRFSDFSGYTRYIMPLEGDIRLFIDNREIRLKKAHPYKFSGSIPVCSANTPGAIDFNVIARDGTEVEVHIAADGDAFNTDRPAIVFALDNIEVNHTPLRRYDTALLSAPFHLSEGKAAIIRR